MIELYNIDCMKYMKTMQNNSVDLTLTDIPYDEVNRKSNGLRNFDKEQADILTFDLSEFLNEVYRVTKNNILIFCGRKQFSKIYEFFADKDGTTRPVVWEKTNPSPINGQYVYLNGMELAVWFKKSTSKVFNAFCKNTVFKYPNGSSKVHPTEKNHALIKELIQDNSNEGDIVFDPCFGGGTHLLIAYQLGRKVIGCEMCSNFFEIAKERLENINILDEW